MIHICIQPWRNMAWYWSRDCNWWVPIKANVLQSHGATCFHDSLTLIWAFYSTSWINFLGLTLGGLFSMNNWMKIQVFLQKKVAEIQSLKSKNLKNRYQSWRCSRKCWNWKLFRKIKKLFRRATGNRRLNDWLLLNFNGF